MFGGAGTDQVDSDLVARYDCRRKFDIIDCALVQGQSQLGLGQLHYAVQQQHAGQDGLPGKVACKARVVGGNAKSLHRSVQ